MPFHDGTEQPIETIGKKVTYRNFEVEVEKKALPIPGRWHLPHPANELIWTSAPVIGRIIEYKIVG